MISPEFHSAAFLVLLSGLWVAIGMARRHFSCFCVFTQFVMLCVSIFFVSFSRATLHVLNPIFQFIFLA